MNNIASFEKLEQLLQNIAQREVDLLARVSLFELLLEIMHANIFLHRPDPLAALGEFRESLLSISRDLTIPAETDLEFAALVHEEVLVNIERFCGKAAERLAKMMEQAKA